MADSLTTIDKLEDVMTSRFIEQMQELHRNGDKEALGELDDEISAS